jgi:hypothetical protein
MNKTDAPEIKIKKKKIKAIPKSKKVEQPNGKRAFVMTSTLMMPQLRVYVSEADMKKKFRMSLREALIHKDHAWKSKIYLLRNLKATLVLEIILCGGHLPKGIPNRLPVLDRKTIKMRKRGILDVVNDLKAKPVVWKPPVRKTGLESDDDSDISEVYEKLSDDDYLFDEMEKQKAGAKMDMDGDESDVGEEENRVDEGKQTVDVNF